MNLQHVHWYKLFTLLFFSLPLAEFATNEAIQCTEIYEYAKSLGSQSYFTVNFQVRTVLLCVVIKQLSYNWDSTLNYVYMMAWCRFDSKFIFFSVYFYFFQSFKFLYACRLAENGFAQEVSNLVFSNPPPPKKIKSLYEINRCTYVIHWYHG